MKSRTLIVMPAYNAERTIERIIADIPQGCCDEILVVDDCSLDRTVEIARRLPVSLVAHSRNLGYGANQKTCYREALDRGAKYVVMLHADYQYDARMIPAALIVLGTGVCDVVLGSRIRTRAEALAGGMPRAKYFANRSLTLIENVLAGQNLGEWHSGFRAYRRAVLETIPFEENSDDFVFDSQILVQSIHFGFHVGDIPVPARYFEEASSIRFSAASRYAVLTLWTFARWYAHRTGIFPSPLFVPANRAGRPARVPGSALP